MIQSLGESDTRPSILVCCFDKWYRHRYIGLTIIGVLACSMRVRRVFIAGYSLVSSLPSSNEQCHVSICLLSDQLVGSMFAGYVLAEMIEQLLNIFFILATQSSDSLVR